MIASDIQPASGARIDRPPVAQARARLAASFGRRFVVIGDAEEEFDWSAPLRRDHTSTQAVASLPVATRRFNEAGVVPTYVVDYPIVANPASAAAVRAMVAAGECDVGTQLHPWVNPPFEEAVTPANSFTGNLPVPLQRAKLQVLTDMIEAAVGMRPTVYRAGRYGVGPATARLLGEAGYGWTSPCARCSITAPRPDPTSRATRSGRGGSTTGCWKCR